jgi:uncharacterized sulfatase
MSARLSLFPAVAVLITAGLAAGDALAQAPPPRLNVLFIVSDDLNTNLGCYGHPVVQSPHIDRLAPRSVRFDRAYCQYPVCNPSRTSFLSGRRPENSGVLDNLTPPRTRLKDVVFLPQYFRQQGYSSIKVGKVFHTGEEFEDPASWDVDIREVGKFPPDEEKLSARRVQGQRTNNLQWDVLKTPDAQTADGVVARQAAQFLEQAARGDKPFFLAAGFRRPHSPYSAPKRYFDLYPPDRLVLPNEPPEHLAAIPRSALTYDPAEKPLPDDQRRQAIAAYYASISFMDAQVGVLLDAVDRLKLWDRTVVVFLGDHGYHTGEHGGLWHKQTLFEESARVPLLVAAPGKRAGVASPRLVEFVDLYPTLTQLCGLAAPAGLEGTSIVPLLEDPNRPWKKAAFTVVRRPDGTLGRSARTERYRYTDWGEGQPVQLYDHQADPREYTNLAKDPAHAATVAELRAVLRTGWKAALPPDGPP